VRKSAAALLLVLAIGAEAPLAVAQAQPTKAFVSPSVASGLLMRRIPPVYPSTAQGQHIQGDVVLKVNTDKQGNVTDIEMVSGDPALAPAAIEAVRKWKYHPFALHGVLLPMETLVSVSFTVSK
jgi:TonB family protein